MTRVQAGRQGNRGSIPGRCSTLQGVQAGSETRPTSYPMGAGRSFAAVKVPGYEADNWPPFSEKDKNAWKYSSTSPYVPLA